VLSAPMPPRRPRWGPWGPTASPLSSTVRLDPQAFLSSSDSDSEYEEFTAGEASAWQVEGAESPGDMPRMMPDAADGDADECDDPPSFASCAGSPGVSEAAATASVKKQRAPRGTSDKYLKKVRFAEHAMSRWSMCWGGGGAPLPRCLALPCVRSLHRCCRALSLSNAFAVCCLLLRQKAALLASGCSEPASKKTKVKDHGEPWVLSDKTTSMFRARNVIDAFLPASFFSLSTASLLAMPMTAHLRHDQDPVGEEFVQFRRENDSRDMSRSFSLLLARMISLFHQDNIGDGDEPSSAGLAIQGLERTSLVHDKVSYAISKCM
jgi:hypothetical protein